ncbi:DUF2892 domain-containing protein [Hymenobacter sp. NST-14]|uniref:YgaP family membrane protein n=1 Tax=Hymenobacter piscis TaxID=2839984 RepID=UPI001C03A093|nr:DUF2892 domain-containing protein [Hymenobacter piscis]MBT9395023.1 DUF2892 domain-containing protein [Hymenobacter piscis]
MLFRRNMGTADRALRVVAALTVLVLYLTGTLSGPIATGLLVVAGIFVLTSFVGFCPLYKPFGISTCSR